MSKPREYWIKPEDHTVHWGNVPNSIHVIEKSAADKLAQALEDIVYGEPKENSTTYPYAEKLLKEYRGEE